MNTPAAGPGDVTVTPSPGQAVRGPLVVTIGDLRVFIPDDGAPLFMASGPDVPAQAVKVTRATHTVWTPPPSSTDEPTPDAGGSP